MPSIIIDNAIHCFKVDRKGTAKVTFLKELEARIQKKWELEKVFEIDAPKVLQHYRIYSCTSQTRV